MHSMISGLVALAAQRQGLAIPRLAILLRMFAVRRTSRRHPPHLLKAVCHALEELESDLVLHRHTFQYPSRYTSSALSLAGPWQCLFHAYTVSLSAAHRFH